MSAAVVHALFDRGKGALPVYVPAIYSILVSLVITMFVFSAGMDTIRRDRKQQMTNEENDTLKEYRWVVMLGFLIFVCGMLYDFLQSELYAIAAFRANRQHFVNLHWLKEYKKAIIS